MVIVESTYICIGTFFGMTQSEAGLMFNTTVKSGPLWCEIAQRYLHKASDDVDTYFRDQVNLQSVFLFKELLNAHVNSERALFCYLCRSSWHTFLFYFFLFCFCLFVSKYEHMIYDMCMLQEIRG